MIRLRCLPGRSGWQIEIFGDNFAQITNCWSIFIFTLLLNPQKVSVCLKQAKNAFEEPYEKSLHIVQYQDNFFNKICWIMPEKLHCLLWSDSSFDSVSTCPETVNGYFMNVP